MTCARSERAGPLRSGSASSFVTSEYQIVLDACVLVNAALRKLRNTLLRIVDRPVSISRAREGHPGGDCWACRWAQHPSELEVEKCG